MGLNIIETLSKYSGLIRDVVQSFGSLHSRGWFTYQLIQFANFQSNVADKSDSDIVEKIVEVVQHGVVPQDTT